MANKERQGPDSSQVTQDQDLFEKRARLPTPDELVELIRRAGQAPGVSRDLYDEPGDEEPGLDERGRNFVITF